MNNLDLKNLTADEKAQLKAQLDAEEKAAKERQKRERQNYEQIKDAQIKTTFKTLSRISSELENSKTNVFGEFKAILELKQDLFELSDEQMLTQESHTFTTTDGSVSIIIGHNVIDGWDETVSVGIEKVNQWLSKLAKDDESAMLVGLIRDLMKPNKDGMLKASRVLDLSKKASEIGDKELISAVDIIRDSYKPVKTGTFVKARYIDDNGAKQWLPLSMSAV